VGQEEYLQKSGEGRVEKFLQFGQVMQTLHQLKFA